MALVCSCFEVYGHLYWDPVAPGVYYPCLFPVLCARCVCVPVCPCALGVLRVSVLCLRDRKHFCNVLLASSLLPQRT